MDTLPATIPEHVFRLFWDADKSGIDVRRHARYIICRILDFGDSPEVKWMLDTFGEETVRQVVASNPPLHPKTANYWRRRLGLPEAWDTTRNLQADSGHVPRPEKPDV